MALLALPVWTIPPDWSNSVNEFLEWKTVVMASTAQAEQRQAVRLSPRRSFEFMVRPTGAWRTYFDALLSIAPMPDFYVPLWHDVSCLAEPFAPGDFTIVVAGVRNELATATALFLPGKEPYAYEMAEVTSVAEADGNTVFTIVDTALHTWAAQSHIYAAVHGRLQDQPQYDRLSDRVAQASVRFNLMRDNDWPYAASLASYGGFPIIEFEANEGDRQLGSYFRNIAVVDNSVGLPYQKDFGFTSTPTFNVTNFVSGRAASEGLRSMLYALRGRRNAFWAVYPTEDFVLARSVAAVGTAIVVRRGGFTDLGGPKVGRANVHIKLRDGSAITLGIVSSAINDDGKTETLQLAGAVGVAFTPRDVVRISFAALARLDQDLISLGHETDTDGVCRVALAVKFSPDTRVANDWTPAPNPPVPVRVPHIAQLVIPVDGHGVPSNAVVDWPRGVVYLISYSPPSIRTFTTEPIAQTVKTFTFYGSYMFAGDFNPINGEFVAQISTGLYNGAPVNRYSAGEFKLLSSFGYDTSAPEWPDSVQASEQLVCVESNGICYAVLKATVFSGYLSVIQLPDMLPVYQAVVVSGCVANRAIMCRGKSSLAGGSVYATWNGLVNGVSATIPLYVLEITAAGLISSSTIGTIPAAAVDPTWTHLLCRAVCYDSADNGVILHVTTTDAVTNTRYLVKVDALTLAVRWATAVPLIDSQLYDYGFNSFSAGSLTIFSSGVIHTINSITGALTSVPTEGVYGTPANVRADNSSGVVLARVSYNQQLTGIKPVDGTPTSFTGWALIGPPGC